MALIGRPDLDLWPHVLFPNIFGCFCLHLCVRTVHNQLIRRSQYLGF